MDRYLISGTRMVTKVINGIWGRLDLEQRLQVGKYWLYSGRLTFNPGLTQNSGQIFSVPICKLKNAFFINLA